MNEEYARKLMNKIHLLTFFIVKCEEEDPLEPGDEKWHPDFEKAIQSILTANEEGALPEDELHEFNDMYQKWSNRFDKLGLSKRPIEHWKEPLEPEVCELLEEHYEQK